MQSTAVITGANSMDGKTLAHFLLNKGYKVILTYRRNTFFDELSLRKIFVNDLLANPNSSLFFEPCDISCHSSVKACILSVLEHHGHIDELYLLAANSHVGDSFRNKELSIQTNGQSVYFFLETLKNHSRDTRTYFAATSELVGGIDSGTFDETCLWNPRSPYAIGKELGARWVNFYRDSLDANLFACYGVLFNHSNTYRSQDFAIRKITNTAAKIALGKTDKLTLGHLDWARDEHWSDFGCEAMWKMLQLDSPDNFVVGNGECHWGEEFVESAFSYFNLDWKKHVVFSDEFKRPNEVVRLISNPVKAEAKLGWIKNRISFKKHIELMCDYDYQLESGQTPIRPDVFKITESS